MCQCRTGSNFKLTREAAGALDSYLRLHAAAAAAYHLYRAAAEALPRRVLEIERLDTISRNTLESLQRVFPYGVPAGTLRLARTGRFAPGFQVARRSRTR